MIHILIAGLILLLIASYSINGKDFFAPATMMIISLTISGFCAVYNLPKWQFCLRLRTVFFILTCMILSIAINSLVNNYYAFNHKKGVIIEEHLLPISSFMSIVAIIILGGACVIIYRSVAKIGGGGSFNMMMQNYRAKSAYSTDVENQLPNSIRQIINFSNSLCYIFVFNIIYFWKELSAKDKIENFIVVVLFLISSLLTGGRFSALCLIVAAFIMFYLIKIKKTKRYKVLGLKTIIKVSALLLVVLYGFYAVKELVGRESDDSILDYVTHYMGGSIPGFDLYIKDPIYDSEIWGKETFYSLNNNLRKLGVSDIPYYYVHHEFRLSNGYSIGNIYTALRDYYYDFGMFGMYVLHAAFTIVFSIFYERIKAKPNNLGIIIYSMMYYGVVFYSISNYFFANCISIGFLIRIFTVAMLYKLLIRKKGDEELDGQANP